MLLQSRFESPYLSKYFLSYECEIPATLNSLALLWSGKIRLECFNDREPIRRLASAKSNVLRHPYFERARYLDKFKTDLRYGALHQSQRFRLYREGKPSIERQYVEAIDKYYAEKDETESGIRLIDKCFKNLINQIAVDPEVSLPFAVNLLLDITPVYSEIPYFRADEPQQDPRLYWVIGDLLNRYSLAGRDASPQDEESPDKQFSGIPVEEIRICSKLKVPFDCLHIYRTRNNDEIRQLTLNLEQEKMHRRLQIYRKQKARFIESQRAPRIANRSASNEIWLYCAPWGSHASQKPDQTPFDTTMINRKYK